MLAKYLNFRNIASVPEFLYQHVFLSLKIKLPKSRKKRTGLILLILFAVQYLVFSQEPDTIRVEYILSMSLEEMLNAEVTSASKIPQKLREVPAIVRVITAGQIKERGYFVLEEALADLPGFNFRNILGFNSYSFMRGAPNQNNLILLLIDGIQVNELNSGGFYGGGQYNLSNVDRIEVVYGPASALYGTNAMSGIINIITIKPEGKGNRHIGGSVGSFATTNLDFGYDYLNKQKNLCFRVSGMYKKSENWNNQAKLYYRKATVRDNTISHHIIKADSLPGQQVGYFRPGYLIGLENQATYQISNNIDLIIGIVYEHEKLAGSFSKTYSSSQDEKPPIPPEPDRINNDLISMYLQSQFKIHNLLVSLKK